MITWWAVIVTQKNQDQVTMLARLFFSQNRRLVLLIAVLGYNIRLRTSDSTNARWLTKRAA